MSQTIFNPKVITGISDLENEIKINVSNILQVMNNWQTALKSKCPRQIKEIAMLLDHNEIFNESLIIKITNLWFDIFNKYAPTYYSSVHSNIVILNLNSIMINTVQILTLISGCKHDWDPIEGVCGEILNRAEIFTDINIQPFSDILLSRQQWTDLLTYEKAQMIKIRKYCLEKNNIKDKNALFELLKKDTQKEKWKRLQKLLWSQFSSLRKRGLI